MKMIAITLLAALTWFQVTAAEAEWLTDFDKAREKAKAENKMILMNFTGSDWCPPCKALHKTVFSSREFAEFANKHLVLVEVDFPNGKSQSEELKKANKALEEKFAVQGFPTVIVLDSKGQELSKKTGYEGEKPKGFIAKIEALKKS